MPELILGLDVGSTSARALLVDLSGRVHGKAQTRLESIHPAPGRVALFRHIRCPVDGVHETARSDAQTRQQCGGCSFRIPDKIIDAMGTPRELRHEGHP